MDAGLGDERDRSVRERIDRLRRLLRCALDQRDGRDESWVSALVSELDRAVFDWMREWMRLTEPPPDRKDADPPAANPPA